MSDDDPGAFAVALRRLREAAALSQEELAERAQLSVKAVSALERGERRRPYPTTIRALAAALSLDDAGRTALAEAARRRPTARTDDATGSDTNEPIPVPPTPTIGREQDRDHVLDLVRRGPVQLLTLTGPGGVGKSRLAWDAAAALAKEGWVVVPVELAAVPTSDLVLPAISRALGLRSGGEDLVIRLASVLGDASRLVVLDNVEHVLDAAPDVAAVLARCPNLRVIATSRAPLRIRAEQVYPVRPLEAPASATIDGVLASPAGRLFLERARAVNPALVLDRAAAAAVASICRRLDGLPLAIELAASHARYVALPQLQHRLEAALGDGRVRDLPVRQRTMRATLDWSLDLCTDDERLLLAGLSVFAGDFDLSGVDAVCGTRIGNPSSTLAGLVEQSLVVVVAPHETAPARYRLLGPVRAYAAALVPAGERGPLARRLADHLATLSNEAGRGLRGIDQAEWLDVLAGEHGNLMAALHTLVTEELPAAARVVSDVWLYWALRGHAAEGLRWVGQVLAAPELQLLDESTRAGALIASAGLCLATGDNPTSLDHAEAAATLARRVSDDALLGEALVLVASAAMFLDDARAAPVIDALETVAFRSGNGWVGAHALATRAQHDIVAGRLADAGSALARADELARASAGPFTLAMVLNVRATHALIEGADDRALDHLAEATAIAVEVETTWTLVYTLPALAGLAARRGDAVTAAALFAAGAAVAERSMHTISFGPDAKAAADQLEQVRRRLEPDEFDRAWELGRTLSGREVLELLDSFTAPGGPA